MNPPTDPLNNLLAEIEAEVNAATPEVFALAFEILERNRLKMVEQVKNDPSIFHLLSCYKAILHLYSWHKILYHRWETSFTYDWRNSWRWENQARSEDSISRNLRRYKSDLMDTFRQIQSKLPKITYRELNVLSLSELIYRVYRWY